VISLYRPLGRTAIAVGTASRSTASSAAVMVPGTGRSGARRRHQETAFCRA
jgi:hypothetical protein